MDIVSSNFLPGDPRLIDQIVYELKSQGIFDQFRKECIADVDTKPAYQNLSQRVEGSVMNFLNQQKFANDINKNQVREQLRKNITESGFLESGVERIVDQVVNPKINTVFLPKVEDVVYRFLGIERPINKEHRHQEVNPCVVDLLPNDLEAVSPESVNDHSLNSSLEKKNETIEEINDNSLNSSNTKTEEDESPPFELLEENTKFSVLEENSGDSQLSGMSGLASHDSPQSTDLKISNEMDISQDVSQNSVNSVSNLSIITSEEDTKMEICEDTKVRLCEDTTMSDVVKLETADLKLETADVKLDTADVQLETSDMKLENASDKTSEEVIEIKQSELKVEVDDIQDAAKVDDIETDKNYEKINVSNNLIETNSAQEVVHSKKTDSIKSESKRTHDKHKSSRSDKDKKEDKDKRSRSKSESKSKDHRDKSSSKHSSSSKEKEKKEYTNGRDGVSEMDKLSKKEDKDKNKDKHSSRPKEKSDKSRERSDKSKDKSDKDKDRPNKEKSDKDKSEKEKDKSEGDKYKSSKDKSDKSKSEKDKHDKDRSSTSKHSSKSSSSSKKDGKEKEKLQEKSSRDSKSLSLKDKTSSSSRHKESSSKDKESSNKDKESSGSKDKESSSKSKESSSGKVKESTSSKDKESSNIKDSSKASKDKDKSKSSSSSSKDKEKEKEKDKKGGGDSKSKGSDKHKKSDKEKSSSHDKSSSSSRKDKEKKVTDDHYSMKDKKNERRSTDRDSNDGSSKMSRNSSFTETYSSSYKGSSKGSSEVFSSGGGESSNSDKLEEKSADDRKVADTVNLLKIEATSPIKYIKPKFASNIHEAMKIMKIRKQLAKMERQNQLALANVPVATNSSSVELKVPQNVLDTKGKDTVSNTLKIPKLKITNLSRSPSKNNGEIKLQVKLERHAETNTRAIIEIARENKTSKNNGEKRHSITDDSSKISSPIKNNDTKMLELQIKLERHIEAKPVVIEAKPVVIEAKSVVIEAKRVVIEAKPVVIEAKPVVIEAKPVVIEAKPVVIEDIPILKSQDLSMECFEALEARLAQEMSNINYHMYGDEDEDNYECSSITISPIKKQKTSEETKITKNNEIRFDTNDKDIKKKAEKKKTLIHKINSKSHVPFKENPYTSYNVDSGGLLDSSQANGTTNSIADTTNVTTDTFAHVTADTVADVTADTSPLSNQSKNKEFEMQLSVEDQVGIPTEESVPINQEEVLRSNCDLIIDSTEDDGQLVIDEEVISEETIILDNENDMMSKENNMMSVECEELPMDETRHEIVDCSEKVVTDGISEMTDKTQVVEQDAGHLENTGVKEYTESNEEFRGFTVVDTDSSKLINIQKLIEKISENIGKLNCLASTESGNLQAPIKIPMHERCMTVSKSGSPLKSVIKKPKSLTSKLDLLRKNVTFQDMDLNDVVKNQNKTKRRSLDETLLCSQEIVCRPTGQLLGLRKTTTFPRVSSDVSDKYEEEGSNRVKWEEDSPCRYFDKSNSISNTKLSILNGFIGRLEKSIKEQSLHIQNNIPKPKKQGRKRKVHGTENNNSIGCDYKPAVKKILLSDANANQNGSNLCNTDVSSQSFSLPLSPSDSDKSGEHKKEEPVTVKPKRGGRGSTKRYSSEDLYKPRPIILSCSSSRRRSGRIDDNRS